MYEKKSLNVYKNKYLDSFCVIIYLSSEKNRMHADLTSLR